MHHPLRAQPADPAWQLKVYHPARHADRHRQVICDTFACEPADCDRWLAVAGEDRFRVLEHQGAYSATAVLNPMGQFFGGQRIASRGIAGVAVPPPLRRDGVGRTLMAEVLREVEAAEEPLSTLYASTAKLYRGVGYDVAGCHFASTLETGYLPQVRTSLEIRALTAEDQLAVEALSHRNGADNPGHMARGEYLWPRLLRPRGKPAQAYGVFDSAGELRGYVAFQVEHRDDLDDFQAMKVLVLEAADREGLEGVLAILRSHHSMVRSMSFTLPPQHPLWMMLPEQRYQMRMREQFLIRLVRVGDALEARGYLPGMELELTLAVHDPVLPANSARWQLQVSQGRATATALGARGCQEDGTPLDPAQADDLEIDAGALASLFAGNQTTRRLSQLGRARGHDRTFAIADAVFAGRASTCPEMF